MFFWLFCQFLPTKCFTYLSLAMHTTMLAIYIVAFNHVWVSGSCLTEERKHQFVNLFKNKAKYEERFHQWSQLQMMWVSYMIFWGGWEMDGWWNYWLNVTAANVCSYNEIVGRFQVMCCAVQDAPMVLLKPVLKHQLKFLCTALCNSSS